MNLRVLLVTQLLGSIVMGVLSPVLPLLAERMSGSQTLAGLSQALITVGAMAASLLLATLAVRHGRRVGVATGSLLGAAGLFAIGVGAIIGSLPVLLAGCLFTGGCIASGLQARFAATDLAERPGRALGILQWASLVGGVSGPLLVPVTELPGLPPMSGPFLVIGVLLAVAGVVAFVFLRTDVVRATRIPLRQALGTVIRIPAARRGLITLVTVHTVMVSLMNMAGLHLHHGGATLTVIGVVISFHVAAMYLPGPLVGFLADRYGPRRLLGTGLALQLAAALVLQTGHGPATIGTGLTLLGLGWSAGFISGTMLLTTTIPAPVRAMAQGASDFLVQLSAAIGALAAGTIVTVLGYAGLCALAALLILAVLAILYWPRRQAAVADHERLPELSKAA